MDKKLGNILKYSLSAALAVVLLWFSFRGVDWDTFYAGLGKCNWQYVILSMLIGMYAFWIRSRRWRETLLPIDPSTSRITTLNAVNISYIVNMVIPRGGEFARCGIITRHSAKDASGKRLASFDKVLGTVIVDRVWDTLVMLILLAVVFFVFSRRMGDVFTDKLGSFNFSSTALMLAGLGVVILLLALCWFLRDKNKFFAKIWGFVKGIITGIRECLKMPSRGKFLLLTVFLWFAYWATSASVLLALSSADMGFEALGPLDALFLMAIGSISSVIPVPGGFGAYHYLITVALSSIYGIPTETGIIFAVLSHESQALTQILCGGASYLHETFRN